MYVAVKGGERASGTSRSHAQAVPTAAVGSGRTWRRLSGPLRANRARFPLGIDLILTAGDRLAALPRSTTTGE